MKASTHSGRISWNLTNGTAVRRERQLVITLSPMTWIITRLRMALVLDPSGVTVTIYRARTVPWADVPRFEPGSNWMGGARIVTTGGVLRSRVPCSGMGLSAQRHFTADDRAYVAGRY